MADNFTKTPQKGFCRISPGYPWAICNSLYQSAVHDYAVGERGNASIHLPVKSQIPDCTAVCKNAGAQRTSTIYYVVI